MSVKQNTPAWITSDALDGGDAPSLAVPSLDDSTASNHSRGILDPLGLLRSLPSHAEIEEHLPWYVTMMRLANIAAMVLLIVASIASIFAFPTLHDFVYSFYCLAFAALVIAHESQLRWFREVVVSNFGFLSDFNFRLLFYLLLASLSWGKGMLGFICALVILVCAALNCYIIYHFPQYGKLRDKMIKREDKDIERRMTSLAAQQIAQQIAQQTPVEAL